MKRFVIRDRRPEVRARRTSHSGASFSAPCTVEDLEVNFSSRMNSSMACKLSSYVSHLWS